MLCKKFLSKALIVPNLIYFVNDNSVNYQDSYENRNNEILKKKDTKIIVILNREYPILINPTALGFKLSFSF